MEAVPFSPIRQELQEMKLHKKSRFVGLLFSQDFVNCIMMMMIIIFIIESITEAARRKIFHYRSIVTHYAVALITSSL
jgi:hypothetical protein